MKIKLDENDEYKKKDLIDYKVLGSRIKKARIKFGITQSALAEYVDKCPEYISKLESGISKPSLETLASICNSLKISISYAIEGTEVKTQSYMSSEIYETIKSFEPEQLKEILSFADQLKKYNTNPKKTK